MSSSFNFARTNLVYTLDRPRIDNWPYIFIDVSLHHGNKIMLNWYYSQISIHRFISHLTIRPSTRAGTYRLNIDIATPAQKRHVANNISVKITGSWQIELIRENCTRVNNPLYSSNHSRLCNSYRHGCVLHAEECATAVFAYQGRECHQQEL